MCTFKIVKNKLIIMTIIVVLFNFMYVPSVSAKSYLAQAGGKLLEPICEFFIFAR